MAFFSRFFKTPERVPLPTLEELLEAKGLRADISGLEPLLEEFLPLNAIDRGHWVDAVAELQHKGWPLPPVWLDAQADLIPQVIPTWIAEKDGFYSKPIIEGLSLRVLACGRLMPAAWLTIWGLGSGEVVDRAMEQFLERSKDVPFQRLPSGIYQGRFQDGHSASRILLPSLWSSLFPGQNTFVAVPSEDILLIAPQVLLPKLLETISQTLQGPAPRMLATIFQQIGDNFLPANLQDPHPMAQPQRELRQNDLLEAYRAQEAAFPTELGNPAPVGVLKTQAGRSVSFATWQEGRPALVPETDLVGFVAASGRPMGIYFRQTLLRIPELRGTAVDIWGPRRSRYEGFPTDEQLERLECFATPEQMISIFKSAPAPSGPGRSASPSLSHQDQAASGALSAQSSSPVPQHLRGISLGVQSAK